VASGVLSGTVSSLPLSAVDHPPRARLVVQSRAVKPWPRAGLPWLLPHVHKVEMVGVWSVELTRKVGGVLCHCVGAQGCGACDALEVG
jgi:hypothetical protein